MASEDTVALEFYAPWPNYGVKLSEQWGEIRTDTAHLAPLVRGIGLDASGDFSTLDAVEQTAMQAFELGEDGFHNKVRLHWNKTATRLEVQSNIPPGTEEIPNWYTVWAVDDDGVVTQLSTPVNMQNVGGGTGVFRDKVGTLFSLKSLLAGTNMSLSSAANTITINTDGEPNTYSSDQAAAPSGEPNTGVEIILSDSGKTGEDLPFKAIKAGPNVIVRNTGTAIEIESTAQVVEFYGIRVSDTSFINTFPEVHHMVFNREDFYLTQEKTTPSNKTIIVNSISDPFNSNDYVAVIGDDMTGQLAMHDGTVGEPSIGFTLETDSGIYRRADNDIAIAVAGADVMRVLSDRVYFPQDLQVLADGTAAGPDIYWSTNSTTGLFQNTPGDDSIAFATAGIRAGWFDANQQFNVNHLNAGHIEAGTGVFYTSFIADKFLARRDGTVAAVAFGWEADPAMGLFRHTNGNLHFAKGGATTLAISSTQIYPILPIRASTGGTLSAPIYSFDAENNTGMYQNAIGTLDFAVDGTRAAYLSPTLLTTVAGITASGDIRTGATGTGTFIVGANGSVTAPSIKWSTRTNTGLYFTTEGTYGIGCSANGAYVWIASATGSASGGPELAMPTSSTFRAGNGSATYPSVNFGANAEGCGLYKYGTDQLGFSTNSLYCGHIDSNRRWYFDQELRAGSGSLTSVTYSFKATGQTDVGMYNPGTDRVGFAANGVLIGEFDGSAATAILKSTGVVHANLAAANDPTAPHYTFGSDTTSGLYLPVAGEVGITVSNVKELSVTSSGVTATTNFITVDEAYGASWDSSLTVPTKNALYDKIETLSSDIPPAFYGVIFKESESGGAVVRDDTLVVDSDYFYLTGRPDGKPLLSLLDSPTTASNLGSGAGVFAQKTGSTVELKSIRGQDQTVSITNDSTQIYVSATGTFYTPVSVQGADPSLTVGNAGATDSVVKFYDEGTLAYTMGWDESASAFKIASGVLDDTNDEVTITDELVEVKHKLHAGRVEAGDGLFYTQVLAGKGKSTAPSYSFKMDTDTGLFVGGAGAGTYLGISYAGQATHVITTSYTQTTYPIRIQTNASPQYSFLSDPTTGWHQLSTGTGQMNAVISGNQQGYWDAAGLNIVSGTGAGGMLKAGRVEAGIGNFYTSLDVDGWITTWDDAYAAGWNGSLQVPTKNAVYDQIETVSAHASSDGSSHTFIDQDVTSGSSPTFTGTNFTGIPETGITDGALLARVADNETIAGTWTFTGNPTISNTAPTLTFDDTTGSAVDWSIVVDGNNMTTAPSAVALTSINYLDSALNLYTSFPDVSAGTNVAVTFNPTIAMSGIAPAIRGLLFNPTLTSTAIIPSWSSVADTGSYTASSGNSVSTFLLFTSQSKLYSTGAGINTMSPYIFHSNYTLSATNVNAGTLSATIPPTSFVAAPRFETTGASGVYTIAQADTLSSTFELDADNAAGSVTVTTYNDINLKASTQSGSGTKTLTTRNYIKMENETFAGTTSGIYSEIGHSSSANKYFINHVGGADSHHTGDFYIHSGLYADTVNADIGNFYASLRLNKRDMLFGPDGLLYAWDPLRGKYLSITRATQNYGTNMNASTNTWLATQGTVQTGNGGTAFETIRDLTITSVIIMAENLVSATTGIDLRVGAKGAQPPATGVSYDFTSTGTRKSEVFDGINYDVDKGYWIGWLCTAADDGCTVTDPIVQMEYAWRLNI